MCLLWSFEFGTPFWVFVVLKGNATMSPNPLLSVSHQSGSVTTKMAFVPQPFSSHRDPLSGSMMFQACLLGHATELTLKSGRKTYVPTLLRSYNEVDSKFREAYKKACLRLASPPKQKNKRTPAEVGYPPPPPKKKCRPHKKIHGALVLIPVRALVELLSDNSSGAWRFVC